MLTPDRPSSFAYIHAKCIWIDLILLLLVFAPLYFLYLGHSPFATPDEARYVEIPREILATGDWVTPRLNGVKYFEKPPLLYWIEAIFQSIFGIKEWAMRLPITLFGLSGILGTYLFGQRIFNRQTGLLAAFILGSSGLYFALSRLIILDMTVSIFITLSLFSFYVAHLENTLYKRRFYYALFTLFCALAVLTKGIMAIAIIGCVIVLWATLSGSWKSIFPTFLPTNILLFLSITAPWHIMASLRNPEFAYKYFIVEHVLRYTTTIHARYQPVWFFIPILIGGFFPWSAFFAPALIKAFRNRASSHYLFLLIWILFVFTFFSLSHSKLIPYILPLFPPMALLISCLLDEWLSQSIANETEIQLKPQIKSPEQRLVYLFILCLLLGIGSCQIHFFFPEINTDKILLKPYVNILSFCFFATALCAIPIPLCRNYISNLNILKRLSLNNPLAIRLSGISLLSLIILLFLIPASPHIIRPSLQPLVTIALQQRQPNEPFVAYMKYFQDLPLYAHERVVVVETKDELLFGTEVEDTTSWMIGNDYFKKMLVHGKTRYWIFARIDGLTRLKQENPHIEFKEISCDRGVCLVVNTIKLEK